MDSTERQQLVAALMTEAERIQEDTLHSAKGHFEAAASWDKRHLWIGVPMTIAAAVAGVSALSKYSIAAALVSFLVAALSALFTFLNPKEHAAKHLTAGNTFNALRNDARVFREIYCAQGLPGEELVSFLQELNARRSKLNAESPQIPPWAYKRAKKGIDVGEATYAADRKRKE